MAVSPVTQKAIEIFAQTEKTRGDIATAVLAKQLSADEQQGQAMVKLIDQAAKATRGIDVKA